MLTSLAHTAVCVPDVEEAVRWYESVIGLTVIWSPVLMENDDIEKDMGELIPSPVAVKAAILGVGDADVSGDRVIEVIQYPRAPARPQPDVTTQIQSAATATTLGPLDQHLVPDVLVRLPAPLQPSQTQQLAGLVPPGRAVTLRTGKLKLAGPAASGDVSVAGVDPASF